MISLHFNIDGWPRVQARPRTVSKGGRRWTYSPRAAGRWRETLVAALTAEFAGPIIVADVTVSVIFYGASKAADLDNLAKPILDALQLAKVIKDDKQVAELHLYRESAQGRPGVDITVMSI